MSATFISRSPLGPGAEDRLTRVMRANQAILVASLRRRTGDHELAEEAVQTAFQRAVARDESFVDDDHCIAWLRVVSANVAVDAMRRTAREHPHDHAALEATAPSSSAPSPEQTALAREQLGALAASWAVLTRREQALLARNAVHGDSVATIAAAEGMTAGSVRVTISRARTKLRLNFESRAAAIVPLVFPWLRRANKATTAQPVAGLALGVAATVVAATAVGVAPWTPADAGDDPARRAMAAAPASAGFGLPQPHHDPTPLGASDVHVHPEDAPTTGAPNRAHGRVLLPTGKESDVILPGGDPDEELGRVGIWVDYTVAGITIETGADLASPAPLGREACLFVTNEGTHVGRCPDDEHDARIGVHGNPLGS